MTYGEEETAAEVGRKPLFTPEKIADKAEKKEEKPQEKKPAVKVAAPVDKEALRKELASKQEVLQNAPAKVEKTEKSEKRRDNKRERGERKERPAKEAFVPVYEGTEAAADDEKAIAIKNFLTGLLQQMECEAEVKVFEKETHQYKVYLEGDKLGQLIGRRGETLDAIQQLTNY
ncbi:MAG: KH domain-containing protein, partial [Oscillospiraceae bacterium]|nr:KH domain-containing protein [Oscillospiraceae bacterium]